MCLGGKELDRINGSSFPWLIQQLDHCSTHLQATSWMQVLG